MVKKKSTPMKCHRCSHQWMYTGKKIKLMKKFHQYITCPKCHTSVKLVEQKEKKNGKD